MPTPSEFDIALARRVNILNPKTLANASPEFVRYWSQVQKEIERRNALKPSAKRHNPPIQP